MNDAAIKRAILADEDRFGIRKRIMQDIPEMTDGERIEMGEALERMTESKGWAYVDAFIIGNCNPNRILFDSTQETQLEARGMLKVMQYVNQSIKAKNELVRKDNEAR